MQAELQPEYPLVYSSGGFRYCDLLLSGAERAAWRITLGSLIEAAGGEGSKPANRVAGSCDHVIERTTQTLEWVSEENWLLDIALDRLTLGRAALYRWLAESVELRGEGGDPVAPGHCPSDLNHHLDAAVDGIPGEGRGSPAEGAWERL